MFISELARPGDKIDITYLHQNNGKVYKSSLFDIINDTEIEIGMPTDGGKMVLFQVGFEFELSFFTQRGIYICDGKVIGRYKKDNFYTMTVKMLSAPKKYQRRDYYRVDCLIDFSYYKITEEVANLETTEDLFDEIADPKYIPEKKFATTKDISGGGIRFVVGEDLEVNSYVLMVIKLSNEKIDQTFYLVAQMIACNPIQKKPDKRVARARFIFKDPKDRDRIVRFVFEEDRMMRKKVNG